MFSSRLWLELGDLDDGDLKRVKLIVSGEGGSCDITLCG